MLVILQEAKAMKDALKVTAEAKAVAATESSAKKAVKASEEKKKANAKLVTTALIQELRALKPYQVCIS